MYSCVVSSMAERHSLKMFIRVRFPYLAPVFAFMGRVKSHSEARAHLIMAGVGGALVTKYNPAGGVVRAQREKLCSYKNIG